MYLAPQVQRLFEGGVYLKIGRNKEICSFHLTVYFLSVRKFCCYQQRRLLFVMAPFVSSGTFQLLLAVVTSY